MKKKFTAKKVDIFKIKIAIYLSLGLHEGSPSYRKSLQPSKENIHHFKTGNFLTFSYFRGSFLPFYPDPESGSGCTDNPDPIQIRNTAYKPPSPTNKDILSKRVISSPFLPIFFSKIS
jgi:hypothetical protein